MRSYEIPDTRTGTKAYARYYSYSGYSKRREKKKKKKRYVRTHVPFEPIVKVLSSIVDRQKYVSLVAVLPSTYYISQYRLSPWSKTAPKAGAGEYLRGGKRYCCISQIK